MEADTTKALVIIRNTLRRALEQAGPDRDYQDRINVLYEAAESAAGVADRALPPGAPSGYARAVPQPI